MPGVFDTFPNFLSIYDKYIIEFDTSTARPTSSEGWKDSGTYSKLRKKRGARPGCAKLGSKVIISGGGWQDDGNAWKSHKSTEILDLTTKTLSIGIDMKEPRRNFDINLVQVEDRVGRGKGIVVVSTKLVCGV